MAHIAFTCPSKIRERTFEAREKKAPSLGRATRLLGLWRRACMVVAEWGSRALQRDRLDLLNDHLLADVGLRREKQIVEGSTLFCWLP